MALREVKPLDNKQWNQVVDILKKGPTTQQRKMMTEAIAKAKKLNVQRD